MIGCSGVIWNIVYNLVVLSVIFVVFFFFFQAEDGIRDLYVTGVQTCALPISSEALGSCAALPPAAAGSGKTATAGALARAAARALAAAAGSVGKCVTNKIGRASCRERV